MANVVTPPFRVSYPNVFKPQLNKLSNKSEFGLEALFPKDADLSKLKKAAQEALEKKFGADRTKWPKQLKTPFRLQDEKEKEDEATGKKVMPPATEKGAIFMRFKSAQRPAVVDQNVQQILDETQFYPGCWAVASVNAYAYDQAGNRGVAFGLVNIQKVKDGDPLGGRTRAEDDFAPVAGAGTEDGVAATGSATDLFS